MEVSESQFPRLRASRRYEIRSPADPNYNCIAFAVGDSVRWWWPGPSGTFWPPNAPRAQTLEAFATAFHTVGYQVCADGSFETGFEKIALYAVGDTPTHAARQEPTTGMWLSKLGMSYDIAHAGVEDVGGGVYGEPVCYMRRRISEVAG